MWAGSGVSEPCIVYVCVRRDAARTAHDGADPGHCVTDVQALLGFEVWSHTVYRSIVGEAHGGEDHHGGSSG